jgi:hypothetical protein
MGLEDMARSHRRGAIVAAESDEAASNLHHETTPIRVFISLRDYCPCGLKRSLSRTS